MRISDWSSDVCSSDLLALHVGAGEAVQLLLDLALEEAAKLVEAFETHRLGEGVVGLGLARRLHLVDRDVKGRCLTLEVFDVVVGRAGNVYRALLIGLGADQLEIGSASCRERVCQYG